MAEIVAPKTYKMIVLASRPSEMRSVFEQLKARNILTYPISSVDAAMKLLQSGAVDYCLLSVDNPKIKIDELPQQIENGFNIPVIAISELRDKQSMFRLTKVRTKNVLYSKANAHNIFQRIELIRNAQAYTRTRATKSPSEESSTKLLFLSEAPPPPKQRQSRLLSNPQDEAAALGLVRLTGEVKFRGVVQTIFKKVAPTRDEAPEIIRGCLKEVLSEYCNPELGTEPSNEFSKSMVISVNSKDLTGTFIIATQFDAPKLGEVQTQLYEHLRTFGFYWEQHEIKVEVLTDQKLPADLINAGVYVSGTGKDGEVAISYFPEAVEVPELTLTNSTHHVLDPENLVKNTSINFDIFLHMKANGRELHYLKADSKINDKQIGKLKNSSVSSLVPRNQLSNLNEYVLLQRLLKLMNPDAIEEEIQELLRIS